MVRIEELNGNDSADSSDKESISDFNDDDDDINYFGSIDINDFDWANSTMEDAAAAIAVCDSKFSQPSDGLSFQNLQIIVQRGLDIHTLARCMLVNWGDDENVSWGVSTIISRGFDPCDPFVLTGFRCAGFHPELLDRMFWKFGGGENTDTSYKWNNAMSTIFENYLHCMEAGDYIKQHQFVHWIAAASVARNTQAVRGLLAVWFANYPRKMIHSCIIPVVDVLDPRLGSRAWWIGLVQNWFDLETALAECLVSQAERTSDRVVALECEDVDFVLFLANAALAYDFLVTIPTIVKFRVLSHRTQVYAINCRDVIATDLVRVMPPAVLLRYIMNGALVGHNHDTEQDIRSWMVISRDQAEQVRIRCKFIEFTNVRIPSGINLFGFDYDDGGLSESSSVVGHGQVFVETDLHATTIYQQPS